MKAISSVPSLLISLVSIRLQLIAAFQVDCLSAYLRKTTFGSPRQHSVILASPASVVSVCTADLCCCQDEGLGGAEILADLQNRNLPYPIDEAPCLGACGGGAMVAIDFEDGTFAMVSGIDETLAELGLAKDKPLSATVTAQASEPTTAYAPKTLSIEVPANINTVASPAKDYVDTVTTQEAVAAITVTNAAAAAGVEEVLVVTAASTPKEDLDDTRERMRAAAMEDKDQVNPWLNAASYLAGKATEKLFG